MPLRLVGQQVLVVGPGWLGGAIAATLANEGSLVWTLRRSTGQPLGVPTRVGALTGDIRTDDVSQPPSGAWTNDIPATLDHVVVCIAPSRSAGDDHGSTYPAAVRGALAIAAARGARSVVYTSSTGVYGRSNGSDVHESDPVVGLDERQRALVAAEDVLRDNSVGAGVGRTVLRVAGLYGMGRDPAPRFRAVIPTGAADVWCNFAWRDDVVSAVRRVLAAPAPSGERVVYNCADGTPLRASLIARALGATRHADEAPPVGARSNQRVIVEGLRQTGWAPSMPTVLDGLVALGHEINRSVLHDRGNDD